MTHKAKHAFAAAAALVLAAVLPLAAAAAVIAPGENLTVPGAPPRTPPEGTKLAEKTIPFSLNFARPGEEAGLSDMTADGTLTNSVYRTPSGGLAFVYDVFVEPTRYGSETRLREPVDELSQVIARGFAGLVTDVSGTFEEFEGVFFASRSADGSQISGQQDNGRGRPPYFIIETDATAFDALGTTTFTAGDEFLVTSENDQVYRQSSATLSGTYQPVPEPTGAGLVLTGFGIGMLRRRTRCATPSTHAGC